MFENESGGLPPGDGEFAYAGDAMDTSAFTDWFAEFSPEADSLRRAENFVYYAYPATVKLVDNVIDAESWYETLISGVHNPVGNFGPFAGLSTGTPYLPTIALELGGSGPTQAAITEATAQAGLGTAAELLDADGAPTVKVLGLGWMYAPQSCGHSIDYEYGSTINAPVWFTYSNGVSDATTISFGNFSTAYDESAGSGYEEITIGSDIVETELESDGYTLPDAEFSGLQYKFGYDSAWIGGLLGDGGPDASVEAVTQVVSTMISGNIDILVEALVTSFPDHAATFSRTKKVNFRPSDINMIFGEEESAGSAANRVSIAANTTNTTDTTGMY
jgi:hypothetical protein